MSAEEKGGEESEGETIPGVGFVVPLDQFRRKPVMSATVGTNVADSHDAHSQIQRAIGEVDAEGDSASGQALNVLGQLSGYHFKPDDRIEPYGPFMVMDGRRSSIPTDLLTDQVTILAQLAPDITHPALRARIADVCWLRNKQDANSGLAAVSAFVECVCLVLDGRAQFDFDEKNPASVPAAEFLRRATIIARAMGWKKSEFDALREVIAKVSQHALDRHDGWGFIHIGPINLSNQIWEFAQTAKAAEILANSETMAADHHGRQALWSLAADAYSRAKDSENQNRCLVEAAETLVANADARSDSAFAQAHFLNDAIKALRPIPGTAERRKELQSRLNDVQPQILDELSSFSHETDITELVEATESAVRNKPLPDVIRALLMCERAPDPEQLRKDVLDAAYGSISAMVSMTVSDSQGRTRFVAPGLNLDGPPEEDQVRFLTNQHDSIRRSMVVSARIDPIRRVLMEEHSVSVDSLLPLMQASPFVPPNHEYTFAIGASKFVGGQQLEAAHMILPQLENSLRHILSLAGVETNRINQDGTQEEAMLSRLLEDFREPLAKLLPEALIQQIELLFNFRGGPSIRHELAHGKMSDGEFFGPEAVYATWLVLHITILPTLQSWDAVAAQIEACSRRSHG